VAREGLLIGENLLIPHFGSGVLVRVFGRCLRELGATGHSHDLGVQMVLVDSFWMISEGKEKLGIGNFSSFFLSSTENIEL
jgi:hypothetical protein